MSDVGPYGVHQHAALGAVRAHTLVGEPIDHLTVNQVGASPATFSSAPYLGSPQPPKPTLSAAQRDRLNRCSGKDNTCKCRPIHGTNLCWFHTKWAKHESPATP